MGGIYYIILGTNLLLNIFPINNSKLCNAIRLFFIEYYVALFADVVILFNIGLQVYEIEVKIGDYMFTVFRAYKDFYHLHESMKKEFSKQLPQFPQKIYLRRSEVKSIAKQRANDLNIYLRVRINLYFNIIKVNMIINIVLLNIRRIHWIDNIIHVTQTNYLYI